MKNIITAAVVSALVATASTAAATNWVNGRLIKPHTIAANRLSQKALDKLKGEVGPQGQQGTEGPAGPQGMSIFAYPNPEHPNTCVDIYQEIHQYTDEQVLVDTICAPGVKKD